MTVQLEPFVHVSLVSTAEDSVSRKEGCVYNKNVTRAWSRTCLLNRVVVKEGAADRALEESRRAVDAHARSALWGAGSRLVLGSQLRVL